MKSFCLFIGILLIFLPGWGATIPTTPCHDKVNELSLKWKAKPKRWQPYGIAIKEQTKAWVAPTDQFGVWLRLYRNKLKSTYVLERMSEGALARAEFNSGCEVSLKVVKNRRDPATAAGLGDDALGGLFKGQTGVVLLSHPQMPLSLEAGKALQKVVSLKGLKFLWLWGPDIRPKRVKGLTGGGNSPQDFYDGLEFQMRMVSLHYPAIFFFKNGEIKDAVKFGYETEKGYELDIKNHLDL